MTAGSGVVLEEGGAYALQTLARHQMIERLLADVRMDMEVCLIEGWDVMEFPRMIAESVPREIERRMGECP